MNPYHRFQTHRFLSEFSTLRIGGPCRYFVEVSTIVSMQEVICHCTQESLPFLVIGKGSNSLFDDRGFNGLVILNKIAFCEYRDPLVYVGSGYSFSLLGVHTARKGLSGLEFASGIPASVGGAIFMNAGANGGETSFSLEEVTFINLLGDLEIFKRQELTFGYRTSPFQEKRGVIAAALFSLTPSSSAREKQVNMIDLRKKTQPLAEMSLGCVFRNPPSMSAGELIQQCGLKGLRVGGAEVSSLHGNFIVNKGGASAKEFLELAQLVQQKVQEKTGVLLEMEVRQVAYDFPC